MELVSFLETNVAQAVLLASPGTVGIERLPWLHLELPLEAFWLPGGTHFSFPGTASFVFWSGRNGGLPLLVDGLLSSRDGCRIARNMADDPAFVVLRYHAVKGAGRYRQGSKIGKPAAESCQAWNCRKATDLPYVQIGQKPVPKGVERRDPEKALGKEGPEKGICSYAGRPIPDQERSSGGRCSSTTRSIARNAR